MTGDSDSGFTLVELIVAVAIMGVAVVGIITGLATAVSSTTYDGRVSKADTAVRDYAATIKAQMAASCTGGGGSFTTAVTPAVPAGIALSPAVGTSETCPIAGAAPSTLTVSASTGTGSGTDGGATDSTKVWLWLP